VVIDEYLKHQTVTARCVRWVGVLLLAGALIALHPAESGRALFRLWALGVFLSFVWLIYLILVTIVGTGMARLRSEGRERLWHLMKMPW
jgi:hypothetical protein